MAKITKNCLDLVKEFEGCYLKAYRDEVVFGRLDMALLIPTKQSLKQRLNPD